jgi:GH35 family endo-1,4-beta-xylanase
MKNLNLFKNRAMIFLIIFAVIACACKKKAQKPVIPAAPIITDADKALSIRQILEKYNVANNFFVGAISTNRFLEAANPIVNTFIKEFSYNTPENQFKLGVVLQSPSAIWRDADYKGLIQLSRTNKQVIRAHCPISPQVSKWTLDDARTGAELSSLITAFLPRMCQDLEANKDVVKWMDVVNETVVPNQTSTYKVGDWFGPMPGTDSWENPFTIIGSENVTSLKVPLYIEQAFTIAKANAPNIKLLYNHHGQMDAISWDKVKETVLYLREKGLRVDAIGWQAHIPLGFEKDAVKMKRLNDLIDWCFVNNLEFHITEFDIKMGPFTDHSMYKTREIDISNTYVGVLNAMLGKIGKGAVGINYWSINDRNDGTAGLYDVNNAPNLVVSKVKEAMLIALKK